MNTLMLYYNCMIITYVYKLIIYNIEICKLSYTVITSTYVCDGMQLFTHKYPKSFPSNQLQDLYPTPYVLEYLKILISST